MSERRSDGDMTRCEFQDCDAVAWRVLSWGPNETTSRRAACWQHEGETDLSKFRDNPRTPPAQPDGEASA